MTSTRRIRKGFRRGIWFYFDWALEVGDGIPSGTGCNDILDRGHIRSKGMKKEITLCLSGEEEFYPKIFKKSVR